MTSLCTSWLFWFVILTSMTVAVVAAFALGWTWGRALGVRANDLKWEVRVRALHEKWERDSKEETVVTPRCDYQPDDDPPHPGEAFHEECGDR